MSQRDAALFLAHSRFQLFIVQYMLRAMPELMRRDNYLVLDMDGKGLPVDTSAWHEVIALTPPVGGTSRGAVSACRAALRRIAGIVDRYQTVDLFVSDVQWPLNNAVYGAFISGERAAKRRARLCNFPDGIGNLQVVYPNWQQRMKDVAKVVLGSLGRAPYTMYRGDILGLELSDVVYSLLPEAIPSLGERVVPIPRIPRTALATEADACLFLGQNYDYFMNARQFGDYAARAATATRALGYDRLYYKPHPLERVDAAVAAFRQQGFEILQDSRTVEEMFLERQMACVVSFNSSALAHLKLFFGDCVRCVSVFSDEVLRYTNVEADAPAKMRHVMELCGVEFHA